MNYPMRKRTEAELEELEEAEFIRGVELKEEESRKLLLPKKQKKKAESVKSATVKSETDASRTDD